MADTPAVTPPDPPTRSLVIVPDTIGLVEGQEHAFAVQPDVPGVNWLTPSAGAITRTGVYTAPKSIRFSQAVVLTATAGDGAKFGTATINLSDSSFWIRCLAAYLAVVTVVLGSALYVVWGRTFAPVPGLSVVVSPPEVTLNVTKDKTQPFTAEVWGVADESKKAVTWSAIGSGKVDAVTGVYTIGDDTTDAHVQVTGASKEDSTRRNTAVVHRTKDTSLVVFPSSNVAQASSAVKFTAAFEHVLPAGTPTPEVESVKWSVSGDRGTVSQDGTYEAPASIAQTEVVIVSAERGNAKAAAHVILQGPKPAGPNLIALAILMGSLGAVLHAVVSFTTYVGSQKFVSTWFLWYIFRPFAGGALALFFYYLISLGKVAGATLDPPWVALLCGLVGMFADKATAKLSEIFDALIGPKTDARTDKLSGAQSAGAAAKGPTPQIGAVTASVPVKVGTAPLVTVTGTNFRIGAAVLVKSVGRPASKVTATSLEVQLSADDTKAPGDVDVVVVNNDGTQSAPKALPVTPP